MFLGFGLSVIEGPERAKEERDKKIREIDEKIDSILKMSLFQYLNHLRGKDKKMKIQMKILTNEEEERLE